MMFDEDVMHEIYCDSLQRVYDGGFNYTFRDAAIIEASSHGFKEEALIYIANELELRDDVERYSDAYKEAYGFRPREDLAWFRDLPAVQRMMELNLLHGKLQKDVEDASFE